MVLYQQGYKVIRFDLPLEPNTVTQSRKQFEPLEEGWMVYEVYLVGEDTIPISYLNFSISVQHDGEEIYRQTDVARPWAVIEGRPGDILTITDFSYQLLPQTITLGELEDIDTAWKA